MFTLKGIVDENSPIDLEDSHSIKTALTVLGHYDDTDTGLSPYPEKKLFHAIRDFQKAKGLKIDGVVKPDGPTHTKIKEVMEKSVQTAGAFHDFIKNWSDMREANTVNADKYFHCKANFEAYKRGWKGQEVAKSLSDIREIYGRRKPDYTLKDELEDQGANQYGRDMADSGKFVDAREACAIYRPKDLDEKY